MITRDDIRAAVTAGVLTEEQAIRLTGFSQERQGLRGTLKPSEEPFELFQGLNEVFIVVGLSILYGGWLAITGLAIFDDFDTAPELAIVFALVALVTLFVCTQYFTVKRRMTAPSIALAVIVGLTLLQLGFGVAESTKLSFQHKSILVTGLCFIGLFAYWAYFRIPFALGLTGLASFALLYSFSLLGGAALFDLENAFLLTADGPFALITIALGFALFALALRFDLSDPHRVTRRAANGFWLHVVAAPAIVNTVALTLLESGSTSAHLLLLAFLLLIALIAVIIDRRSFLMAGAGYAVALSAIVLEDSSPLIILFLGFALVILGAKWEAIRAKTLNTLPKFPAKEKLPPWSSPEREPVE